MRRISLPDRNKVEEILQVALARVVFCFALSYILIVGPRRPKNLAYAPGDRVRYMLERVEQSLQGNLSVQQPTLWGVG